MFSRLSISSFNLGGFSMSSQMGDQNTPDNQSAKESAKAATAAATEEVKASARQAADTVSGEAEYYADQAKGRVAGEVKDVASALRTAAEEMRDGSAQERSFSQIAEGLADASEAIRDKDLGELVGSLSSFAKRNPTAFLGAAALIGFVATRFAKASTDGRYDARNSEPPGVRRHPYSNEELSHTAGSPDVSSPSTIPSGGGDII